jgi:glycerol-3-phosphate dehydrogenase
MLAADKPVLILGAGINGAALARELVLNQVPVTIVDTADIASGASAYSSRLIHGGLRYLEYGEFDLVRESLEERNRLLTLAPQFVHPLRLFIPVTNRFGGWYTQLARFLGLPGGKTSSRSRGLFVVRAGLWMYDRYAKGDILPPQSLHSAGDSGVPRVTAPDVRWLAAYSDAQIPYVERFIVGLLRDADHIARQNRVAFHVYTYHEAVRFGEEVGIRPLASATREFVTTFTPAAIVNATGAWVDATLQRLKIPSDQLMGGTKGSHFVTFRRDLREALQGGGIYAEAKDGRPFFILPFCDGTLVGTTDLPFTGDPATAVASEAELAYLLASVERVFPQVRLQRDDIALHYSGVRPLPYVGKGTPAGITRRHLWQWHDDSKAPMVSLIGGKLTTCRAFAEQTVAELLPKLGAKVESTSRERRLEAPTDLRTMFPASPCVAQTSIPVEAVRFAIRLEWAKTLPDLVERRLMLIFEPQIHVETLHELATILADEGLISPTQIDNEVQRCRERLETHFGRRLMSVSHAA